MVFNKGPERSAQRNYGMIDIAQGEYVMFLDADMILSPNLVAACVDELEKGEAVALYISEIILGTSYWCKVRRFERGFYDATVIDSARIYRRELFCKVGGFDENIDFGEEWDIDKSVKQYGLIMLLNKNRMPLPVDWQLSSMLETLGITNPQGQNVLYHNESDFRVNDYINKKSYYSKGFDKYINKWGKLDRDLKKQFGVWYRFFGVFLGNGKWRKFLLHPILVIGMYCLRVSVGVVFMRNKM